MQKPQPSLIDLSEVSARIEKGKYASLFLLVDSNTHRHCLLPFQKEVPQARDLEILEVEPGEAQKDLSIAEGLWNAMLDLGADRNSLLIALGGGMITDLGGFIASTYKRGIDFLLVPTSLLAMVDAAVGGKTGINLGHSKNQIGTFANPIAIALHPPFLDTLPEKEFLSGYAEMLKHALLQGEATLKQLLDLPEINPEKLNPLIATSQSFKEEIVQRDPFEQSERKVLNLGHTVGHAIEALSHSSGKPIPHGFAVAYGLVVELRISETKLGLDAALSQKVAAHVKTLYPKVPAFETQQLWEIMLQDKKNSAGEVRCVLLASAGAAQVDQSLDIAEFEAAYRYTFS